MVKKFPITPSPSLIELQVLADEDQIDSGLWARFKRFIFGLRNTPEGKASETIIKNYLKQSCIDAFEVKNRTRIQNKKMVAEIDEIRQRIKNDRDGHARANFMFYQECEVTTAEARLKNAQANALETETILKVMSALKESGFDLSVSYEDGRFEIFILDSAANADKNSDIDSGRLPQFIRHRLKKSQNR